MIELFNELHLYEMIIIISLGYILLLFMIK